MYYLINLAFVFSLTIGIVLAYTEEVPSSFVLVFLMIAAVANIFASAYATWKYSKLEDRIKKLENKKEEKE